MATKIFSILGDMIDTDEKRAEVNDKIKVMDYEPYPILKEVDEWDIKERDFIKDRKTGFKSFKKHLFWINNNSWDRPKYLLKNIIEWSASDMGGNKKEAEKLVTQFRKEYKRQYSGSKKFDKENLKKLKNEIYDFYFKQYDFNRNNWKNK
tara:strand:- start:4507 stop:4956 length:450 start_codon:yes stop_codon:yes gene_type:complete